MTMRPIPSEADRAAPVREPASSAANAEEMRPEPRGFVEWEYDADEFDRELEGEEDFFDCHMGPDGFCGAAGSEECEFDCPTMQAWRRGDLP